MSQLVVLALVAMASSLSLSRAQSQEEESAYIEQWRQTIESMTSPPESYSAEDLPCVGTEFEFGGCDIPDIGPAPSVHLLTPFDISVVAAIGDSITAGFGARATGILDFYREARGVSWSIGGDVEADQICTTIPNILKHFNPNIIGASRGYGKSDSDLDVAVSGAKSPGIMSQAEELVKRIREQGLEEEWKLVTLWIGGNDLCQSCMSDDFMPELYYQRIYDTIAYLKSELSYTLVSVPLILDVTKLGAAGTLVCGITHFIACTCSQGDKIPVAEERVREYQNLVKTLDYDPTLNDDDYFAVVTQPFMEDLQIPYKENGDLDMGFFAPDCFHMNTNGHRAFAASLWNNMVTPVEEKTHNWEPYEPVLKCPDPAHPYIYTAYTEAKLAAMQAEREGGFNADSLPNSDEEDDSGHKGSGWGLGQIVGVAVGVVVTVSLAALLVGVAVYVGWHRRRGNSSTEAIPLVKKL